MEENRDITYLGFGASSPPSMFPKIYRNVGNHGENQKYLLEVEASGNTCRSFWGRLFKSPKQQAYLKDIRENHDKKGGFGGHPNVKANPIDSLQLVGFEQMIVDGDFLWNLGNNVYECMERNIMEYGIQWNIVLMEYNGIQF